MPEQQKKTICRRDRVIEITLTWEMSDMEIVTFTFSPDRPPRKSDNRFVVESFNTLLLGAPLFALFIFYWRFYYFLLLHQHLIQEIYCLIII